MAEPLTSLCAEKLRKFAINWVELAASLLRLEDEGEYYSLHLENSKPATGIDDRYPESSFFNAFPCENRRIDDSARGRVGNGRTPLRARDLCRRTGVGGGHRIEHP